MIGYEHDLLYNPRVTFGPPSPPHSTSLHSNVVCRGAWHDFVKGQMISIVTGPCGKERTGRGGKSAVYNKVITWLQFHSPYTPWPRMPSTASTSSPQKTIIRSILFFHVNLCISTSSQRGKVLSGAVRRTYGSRRFSECRLIQSQ